MINCVLIGMWIVISIVVLGIVFVCGVIIGVFSLTKFQYEVIGKRYNFRQFIKDMIGAWRKDN